MFRFILVNDRSLRSDAHCALCCTKIKGSYVREISTKFCYCKNWGSLSSNTVRGPRHEMRSLPQTTRPIRPSLLADAILLDCLRGSISGAA
jgi:hypothetical protein